MMMKGIQVQGQNTAGRRNGAIALACSLCAALSLPACGDDATEAEPTLGSPDPTPDRASTHGADAPLEPNPWPEELQELTTTLAEHESTEVCAARLRRETPVALAETLTDLGYDRYALDTCRALTAVRDRDVAGCDAIEVSAVRRGCRFRLAIVAADPELCPPSATPGRDPVCLAWASRDPGLCRGAEEVGAVHCRAVLAGDRRLCRRPEVPDRERCEAELRRYGSALVGERRESASALTRVVMSATAAPEVGDAAVGDAGTTIEITHPELERGVYLAADGCGHQLSLGGTGSGLRLGRPAWMELDVLIPAGTEAPLRVPIAPDAAHLALKLPSRNDAETNARTEGDFVLMHFRPERGAVIAGRFEARLHRSEDVVSVRGRFRTYVRDVETLPVSCNDGTVVADPGSGAL